MNSSGKAKVEEEEIRNETEIKNMRHLNMVLIGHVDAGKSTIGGQILSLSGVVDQKVIDKYKKRAKEIKRDSWYMAFIMDTNEEEQDKGKTIEVGRAQFQTNNTRFTILDAPGHKMYVPKMIIGAYQADIAVLVVSARKGEFETGYERGGQTREHVQLAKSLGVSKMIVVVNKMDDPTVKWSKERYDEIEHKMTSFLHPPPAEKRKKGNIVFLPISGLFGTNMDKKMDENVCEWWNGPCLFNLLDSIEVLQGDPKGPFRMPITTMLKDNASFVVMGKVESGTIQEGDSMIIMPNREHVKVIKVHWGERSEKNRVRCAGPGENLTICITNIEDIKKDTLLSGFVMCSNTGSLVPVVNEFVAKVKILETFENGIFTAGYKGILHIHAVSEECEILQLIRQIDPKTKKYMKKKIMFAKTGDIVDCRIKVSNPICVEKYSDYNKLGRFILRTEGKTIAEGMVIDVANDDTTATTSDFN